MSGYLETLVLATGYKRTQARRNRLPLGHKTMIISWLICGVLLPISQNHIWRIMVTRWINDRIYFPVNTVAFTSLTRGALKYFPDGFKK